MACYRAIEAWQCENNRIVFNEVETRKYGGSRRVLYLPCGRCIGCRIVRTKEWATRCMNEAQLYDQNCFITLTYDKDPGPSLRYKDFQKFMREVRKKKSYFDVTTWSYVPRFFMSGEYGESNGRPHFHALLFGRSFSDRSPVGVDLYRSAELEKLWPHGFSSVGDVTYESAAYVAGYVCKKVTGEAAKKHYERMDTRTGEIVEVAPEFSRMSLKPGIGYEWFRRYWREVYEARDGIVVRG